MKKKSFFFRNYKIIFLAGSITVFAVCCKSTQPAASDKSKAATVSPLVPVEADVAIAQAHWPGTTFNDLNQGYSIFADKCTDCHRMKKPQDFELNEWAVLMRKMGRKAKLDSTQYNLVYHYILTKREAIIGSGK